MEGMHYNKAMQQNLVIKNTPKLLPKIQQQPVNAKKEVEIPRPTQKKQNMVLEIKQTNYVQHAKQLKPNMQIGQQDHASTQSSNQQLKDLPIAQSSSKLSIHDTLGREKINELTSQSLIENSILQSKFEIAKPQVVLQHLPGQKIQVIYEEPTLKYTESDQYSAYVNEKQPMIDTSSLSLPHAS